MSDKKNKPNFHKTFVSKVGDWEFSVVFYPLTRQYAAMTARHSDMYGEEITGVRITENQEEALDITMRDIRREYESQDHYAWMERQNIRDRAIFS